MGASARGLRRMAETWGAWRGRFDPGLLPSSSTQASQFVRNKIIKQRRKKKRGGEIIFSTSQWPRYNFPRLPSPRCPICPLPRGSCKFPVNPGAESVFDAPSFCTTGTTPGTEWGARSTTRVNATIHGDGQSSLLSPLRFCAQTAHSAAKFLAGRRLGRPRGHTASRGSVSQPRTGPCSPRRCGPSPIHVKRPAPAAAGQASPARLCNSAAGGEAAREPCSRGGRGGRKRREPRRVSFCA